MCEATRELIKGGVDSDRWVRESFLEEVVPQLRRYGNKKVEWGDHCKPREQDRKNGGHRAILSTTPAQEVNRMVKTTALK